MLLGLRKVKPYYYDFHAYVKPRMIGKTILDTYVTEYRGRSELYYVNTLINLQTECLIDILEICNRKGTDHCES